LAANTCDGATIVVTETASNVMSTLRLPRRRTREITDLKLVGIKNPLGPERFAVTLPRQHEPLLHCGIQPIDRYISHSSSIMADQ
jgi:hypothetical protein